MLRIALPPLLHLPLSTGQPSTEAPLYWGEQAAFPPSLTRLLAPYQIIVNNEKNMPIASHNGKRSISIRLSDADIALIDRACSTSGHSRSEYIRAAAIQAAERTLLDLPLIRLSQIGFAEFIDVLAQPTEAISQIVEVMHRPDPWGG